MKSNGPLTKLKQWLQKEFFVSTSASGLGLGIATLAGIKVTEEAALTFSAVFGAVKVLAESVAALPLLMYRRLDRGKGLARDHALFPLLHDLPNPELTSCEFREIQMAALVLWGNAYAEIQRNALGEILALWPIHPSRVQIRRPAVDAPLEYHITLPMGAGRVVLPKSQMLHVRALAMDGVQGMSPIRLHRETVALGLAASEFGARFFGQGMMPGGVLEHPGTLSAAAYDRLDKSIAEKRSGLPHSHRMLILEEGLKYEKLSIPPDDAQWLQCVVPGTLIAMADGTRRPAESIRSGDEVMGWDKGPVQARVAWTAVVDPKPLVRITTDKGRTLTISHDHPCLTQRKLRTAGGRPAPINEQWIRAEDLRTGDYIRTGLGAIRAGSTMSFGQAWFIGAMVGDGYVRAGGCCFANRNADVVAAVAEKVSAFGGQLVRRGNDWDINTGGCGRRGSALRRLFKSSDLVGCHAHTKRVPSAVMRGGHDAWRGFLSGYLDADGSIGEHRVAWSSVNRALLDDGQHLLALLGIQSGIYPLHAGGPRTICGRRSHARPLWGLYVTGSANLRRLAGLLEPVHPEKRARLGAYVDLARSAYRDEFFFYDRVVDTEHLPPSPVVGIEVEGAHTHITNGLVTHNTRKFQVNEIARIYRIPPHKLGDLEKATFSNIEEQSIEFVTDTLTPWLVRWEQAIARDLLDEDERREFFARFKLEGLLRGKTVERYDAYAVGRQWGWESVNSILDLEDRNPIGPEGDIYLSPLNMISAEQALRMVQENPDMEMEQDEGLDAEGRPRRRLTVRRRADARIPVPSGNGAG